MHIIPAIDIYQNRCVRLTKGSFAARRDYGLDPFETALRFSDAGARYLHVVDLEGAEKGCIVNWPSLVDVRGVPNIFIQAGGGVRHRNDVEKLLGLGMNRVIVGSIAFTAREIFEQWIEEFGAGCFCVALDILDGRIAYAGWKTLGKETIEEVVPALLESGIRTFLSTDIQKDGMLEGSNVELYKNLVHRFPEVEWIASGGVRSLDDIRKLEQIGVGGVVIGKALYEGILSLDDLFGGH